MTFNPNADIDPSRVKRRSGGKVAGGVSIAGGLGIVALLLLSQFLGVDLTGLSGIFTGTGAGTQGEDSALAECRTGADANASLDCRIAGAADSLDQYWGEFLPAAGVTYRSVQDLILFSGQTSTACGTGSSGMGPFYCPGDETIYMDTAFFDALAGEVSVELGPLAQMYVVAHEWGHHVQQIAGIMDGLDLSDSGPASDSVRLELQADCFAGAWVAAASSTTDADGDALLIAPTRAEIADALTAAKVVGDDFLQTELGGGVVNREAWTHGSSQSRQTWFTRGMDEGPQGCTTFSVPASEL